MDPLCRKRLITTLLWWGCSTRWVIITGPPSRAKWQNVGKRWPIFVIFFTVKFRKNLRRNVDLKLVPPLKSAAALPCVNNVSGKLHSYTFILATTIMLHVRQYLFHEFCSFFFFLILTSLWHYCNFCLLHYSVLSVMTMNAWHSIEQCTIDASIDQWHSRLLKIHIFAESGHSKHVTEINLCRKTKK